MGPYSIDPAFLGYTGGRPDDPPTRAVITPTRAGKLLHDNPELSIIGKANSRSGQWEGWLGNVEIVEARHLDYDKFMDYLEARLAPGA